MKKKIVVLTGAGISAESGISTFRDSNGLWEGHDIMDVASPIGWDKNPQLVLNFYNTRRKQLHTVVPNLGHKTLAELEKDFDVTVITQNVDNLHEKAGSSNVLHLHGELFKVRSCTDENYILDWTTDLYLGDNDHQGNQLRPHIVWFGEAVPAMEEAITITSQADIFVIIGTSLQVYPAAGLIDYTPASAEIYYIDPKASALQYHQKKAHIIAKNATEGLPILKNILIHQRSF